MTDKTHFLKITNLSKYFERNVPGWTGSRKKHFAVDDVSFNIYEGEILGLIGESGSGKTTLGRCLVRLIDADSGKAEYKKKNIFKLSTADLRVHRSRFQMIFQNPALALNPMHTVERALAEPLVITHQLSGASLQSRLIELLKSVDLEPGLLSHYPSQLSGGQKQRVAIARALAVNPEFIIADEPTASLDASLKQQMLQLLKSLRTKYGTTILFITHDISLMRQLADRIAVMYKGRLVEIGPTSHVLNHPKHPYSRDLISASALCLDTEENNNESELSLSQSTSGCSYLAHCMIAQERCASEIPWLELNETGHSAACLMSGDNRHETEDSAESI